MLRDIKDYFKNEFPWQEAVYIGKIDNSKEKAVCFYDSHASAPKIQTLGGKANRSYNVHPITVLLRFGTNAHEAETKANEIYEFFDEREFTIYDKRVFIISDYDGPVSLGTDEKGVYEYSFEFNLHETK